MYISADRGQDDGVLYCNQSLAFESRISMVDEFTQAEKTNMHLMCEPGAANCNRKVALRLYSEHFPNRVIPDHKMLPRLHRQLYENDPFHVTRQDTGRERHVRIPGLEERILREVESSSSTSTRSIARITLVSKSTVWKIFARTQTFP